MTDKDKIYYELLVLRFRKNDPGALEELIHQFEKRLFYYLRRLVNQEEDAWDILQETWIKVHKNLNQLHQPEKLPAWLYTIARNNAMTHLRKLASYQNYLNESDNQIPEVESPNEFTFEDVAAVHHALAQISLPHREVLTLCFLEDLSIEEIADIIQVPPGTVKSRIYYAKKAIRNILDKEVVKS